MLSDVYICTFSASVLGPLQILLGPDEEIIGPLGRREATSNSGVCAASVKGSKSRKSRISVLCRHAVRRDEDKHLAGGSTAFQRESELAGERVGERFGELVAEGCGHGECVLAVVVAGQTGFVHDAAADGREAVLGIARAAGVPKAAC